MPKVNEKKQAPRKKHKAARKILAILSILILLLLIIILLVPVYLSSSSGQKMLLSKINQNVDGTTDFSSFKIGWFSGLAIDNLSYKAEGIDAKVERVTAEPQYASILGGNISLGNTVIEKPEITVDIAKKQPAPAETPGKAEPSKEETQVPVIGVTNIHLMINNGSVTVNDKGASVVKLEDINSKLELKNPGEQSSFDLKMLVADTSVKTPVGINAEITPSKEFGWSLRGTSGKVTVQAEKLSLQSLESLASAVGVKIEARGTLTVDMVSEIKDGMPRQIQGTIRGSDIRFSHESLKGDTLSTKNLDIKSNVTVSEDIIDISSLHLTTDWLKANAKGKIPLSVKNFEQFLNTDTASFEADMNLDIALLASGLPRTLGLKEGMTLTSGKLEAEIEKTTDGKPAKLKSEAKIAALAGIYNQQKIALSGPVTAKLALSAKGEDIIIETATINAPFADIAVSGTAEQISYDSKVDLEKLVSEVGDFIDMGGYKLAGTLTAKGEALSQAKTRIFRGSTSIKSLKVTNKAGQIVTEPLAKIDHQIALKDQQLLIDQLLIKSSFAEIQSRAALIPLNSKNLSQINLPLTAIIDLRGMTKFAGVFAELPDNLKLEGALKTQLTASGIDDGYRIFTDSTTIKDLVVAYPDKEPFKQKNISLSLEAYIKTAQKAIVVEKLELIGDEIKILKGKFSKSTNHGTTKVTASAQMQYDLQAISTIAGNMMPKDLSITGKRADSISISTHYPEAKSDLAMANMNGIATIGFENAKYMGLVFGKTDIPIKFTDGILNISPFSTPVNGGAINFAGSVNFKKKPAILTLSKPTKIVDNISINEEVSRKMLVYLNPIFAKQGNVTGVANLNCQKLTAPLAGDAKALDLDATVSMQNIQLQATGLIGTILSRANTSSTLNAAIMPTKFTVKNQRLNYDNMQINIDKYPMNFSGDVYLDSRKLNMRLITPYVVTDNFKLNTVNISQAQNSDRISLPITGTIDSQVFNFDQVISQLLQKGLKKQLQEKVGEEIFKGLEGLF